MEPVGEIIILAGMELVSEIVILAGMEPVGKIITLAEWNKRNYEIGRNRICSL